MFGAGHLSSSNSAAPPPPPAPAGLAPVPNPGPGTTLGAVRYFGTCTGRLGRPPAGGVGKLLGWPVPCEVGTEGELSPALTRITF